MLLLPADWVTHFGANLVTTYPPGLGARFRYFERLAPQPGMASIVQRALHNDPAFRAHGVGEMTRLVTREGEYGAYVEIDGEREGSRATKLVGAVFVDEFATALDAIALVPTELPAVRDAFVELLRSDAHGLTGRPRRFFYAPPAGWHGLPSGATANWYPLDFPRNRTNLVVPPAEVVAGGGEQAREAAVAQLALGLELEASTRGELTAHGVRGSVVQLHGRRAGNPAPIYRELALFVVGDRLYRMRLETTNAAQILELRAVFRAVASSFRPLPSGDECRLGEPFASASTLFDHWVS